MPSEVVRLEAEHLGVEERRDLRGKSGGFEAEIGRRGRRRKNMKTARRVAEISVILRNLQQLVAETVELKAMPFQILASTN